MKKLLFVVLMLGSVSLYAGQEDTQTRDEGHLWCEYYGCNYDYSPEVPTLEQKPPVDRMPVEKGSVWQCSPGQDCDYYHKPEVVAAFFWNDDPKDKGEVANPYANYREYITGNTDFINFGRREFATITSNGLFFKTQSHEKDYHHNSNITSRYLHPCPAERKGKDQANARETEK